MYARIENGSVQQFPYSLRRLEMDNPNTSFPSPIKEGTLASFGVYKVADVAAPEVTDTQVAYHTGNLVGVDGQWQREWAIRDKTPEELAEDTKQKKAAIKTRRDEAINAGTTVNGVTVATDDLSQQRITGAALAANIDNTTTVKWKLPDDTFVTLDATQIIGIAQGVRAHVQACFDREAELLAALEAGQSYDIDAGWPVTPE